MVCGPGMHEALLVWMNYELKGKWSELLSSTGYTLVERITLVPTPTWIRLGIHCNDEIPLEKHSNPELDLSSETWEFFHPLSSWAASCTLWDVLSYPLFSSATSKVGIREHGFFGSCTVFSVNFFVGEPWGPESCKSQMPMSFFFFFNYRLMISSSAQFSHKYSRLLMYLLKIHVLVITPKVLFWTEF